LKQSTAGSFHTLSNHHNIRRHITTQLEHNLLHNAFSTRMGMVWVSSNSIAFIPNFKKIVLFFKNLKRNTQHADLISPGLKMDISKNHKGTNIIKYKKCRCIRSSTKCQQQSPKIRQNRCKRSVIAIATRCGPVVKFVGLHLNSEP
jgi:hypothetical protein